MYDIQGQYNKATIYAQTLDDTAYAQILELCNTEAYSDSNIKIMPDAHGGAGCVIGTTMTINKKITPNLVGVDIGCGVLVRKLKSGQEKKFQLESIDKYIRNVLPHGKNHHKDRKILNTNADILSEYSVFAGYSNDYLFTIGAQLGTLGGGNHFIEIAKDKAGDIYLIVHSGSRNFGFKTANHHQRIAKDNNRVQIDKQAIIEKCKAEGREHDIQNTLKLLESKRIVPDHLAYLDYETHPDDFVNYVKDLQICQTFAKLNREQILNLICAEFNLKYEMEFDTIHNYLEVVCQFGFTSGTFDEQTILRKGAVAAYRDQLLIIPINMRDGSLLCRGKGNPDWNYSAPHGAGRLFSRSKAKETLTMEKFKSDMKGIYTSSVSTSTLDECPDAYKPIDEIIGCIEDTVDIVDRLYPIYNFKASE